MKMRSQSKPMIKKNYVVGLLIFWGVVLLGFIVFKQYTLQTGTVVILKTIPIDPRDLFRGDYVILRYDINRIRLDSILSDGGPFKKDDKIYLKLDTSSKYARATQISRNRFDEGLFIEGIITNSNKEVLSAKYGIESYFVPQGTGKEIERKIGKIDVIVAVDKQGNALIKSLQYEGNNL
jgi:uncharacterized membrane-anchored protein